MRFEAASSATRGDRAYQEDTAVLWPPGLPLGAEATAPPSASEMPGPSEPQLLTALADGMGGHTAGALASKMVCEAFIGAGVCASAGDDALEDQSTRLLAGLGAANDAIAKIVAARPELAGMGSTLVAASFTAQGMSWISVGDSPLYLHRRGEIALINEDHSLAPALDQLAREGKITEIQARQDPRRHMLRSAITGEELDLVDVSRKPLKIEPGDYFILASDGIHTLEEDEIARIVTAFGPEGSVGVAKALIRAVSDMRAPHQDNTTVVVVRPLP